MHRGQLNEMFQQLQHLMDQNLQTRRDDDDNRSSEGAREIAHRPALSIDGVHNTEI